MGNSEQSLANGQNNQDVVMNQLLQPQLKIMLLMSYMLLMITDSLEEGIISNTVDFDQVK